MFNAFLGKYLNSNPILDLDPDFAKYSYNPSLVQASTNNLYYWAVS